MFRWVFASCVAGIAALATGASAAELPLSGTLDLATDADGRLAGEAVGDAAGWAVAPAGDVNGDGRPDLLVGAPGADPQGRKDAGTVYVVFGPAGGLPTALGSLAARGFRIDGGAAGHRVGTSVSAAGDVDGDGFGDVLVGAPQWAWGDGDDGPGAAFLVRGGPGTAPVDLGLPSPRVTRFMAGMSERGRRMSRRSPAPCSTWKGSSSRTVRSGPFRGVLTSSASTWLAPRPLSRSASHSKNACSTCF